MLLVYSMIFYQTIHLIANFTYWCKRQVFSSCEITRMTVKTRHWGCFCWSSPILISPLLRLSLKSIISYHYYFPGKTISGRCVSVEIGQDDLKVICSQVWFVQPSIDSGKSHRHRNMFQYKPMCEHRQPDSGVCAETWTIWQVRITILSVFSSKFKELLN